VRRALGTLSWIEHSTIVTDWDNREVRFNLLDKSSFNETTAREALQKEGFREVTVKSGPIGPLSGQG
jgi:hypothetical protein